MSGEDRAPEDRATEGSESLEVGRIVRAGLERVFTAWTDPSMIVHWWGADGVTCPEASVDLRVGGSYRIANATPDGQVMWITGSFLTVDRPNRLAYTWTMEPLGDDNHYSLVEVAFDEVPDGTAITVIQTKIADPTTREIHLGGWLGCLDGLEKLLAEV